MSDQDFEQRFAQSLSDYAEHGVRPFDAVEIAHLAAITQTGAAAALGRQRKAAPGWFRALVLAALLVVMLIAIAFAGGFIRLPTGLIEPSQSPSMTFGDVTPDPSATPGPPGTPLPTFVAGLTPSPGPTAAPEPTPSPSPPASLEPSVIPTIPTLPPVVEPTLEPGPTAEPVGAQILTVEAGDTHACGIRPDATIACWGWNGNGELGDGTVRESWVWPAVTAGVADARAISAGNRFTCAVVGFGDVWCWGEGGAGQLGNGAQNDSAVPVQVVGIDDAIDVTAGAAFACALRDGGQVSCWGMNQLGQLGNGTITHNTGNPTPVAASIADATSISAGWNHVCARRLDFTVWCWGGNGDGATGYGQLGDGTLENRPSPVAVVGLSNVSGVAAGGWSSCAALLDRTVWCWGYNERGGLGNGTTTNSSVPVQVAGLDNVDVVAVGGWHACGLRGNGRIACWGANSDGGTGFGQLGSGDRQDSSVPVPVVGISDGRALSAAWVSTCTIRAGDSVWCWGAGSGMEEPWQIPIPLAGVLEQPIGMVRRTQLTRGF
jgi:alpha-tubulin suppressor-like RCC1 family protein